MSDFSGSETVTLDAKGRLIVPMRMRKGLAPEANDTFKIVQSIDPCVNMYPLDEWARFRETLNALKRGDDEARGYRQAEFVPEHRDASHLAAHLIDHVPVNRSQRHGKWSVR